MNTYPTEQLGLMLSAIETSFSSETNIIKAINGNINLINETIFRIHSHIETTPFLDQQEEIQFFKQIKPKFDGELLYHIRLLRLESQNENAEPAAKLLHYQQEFMRLHSFRSVNRQYCRYVRLDASHHDAYYYLRGTNGENYYVFDGDYPLYYDPRFYARMSYKAACVYASDKLRDYIEDQAQPLVSGNPKSAKELIETLEWDEKKTALAELSYAFYKHKVFKGNPSHAKIARVLGRTFNTDISTNLSKFMEDMRLRKKSRTPFLHGCINSAERGMDEDDLNAL